jgi:hypothetical protein
MPAITVGNPLPIAPLLSAWSDADDDNLGSADASNEGTLRTEREHWDGREALQRDIMNASLGNVSSRMPQLLDKIW